MIMTWDAVILCLDGVNSEIMTAIHKFPTFSLLLAATAEYEFYGSLIF